MKITNKLNLPKCFITESNHEYIENRYSVTELLKPAHEINLTRKYDSKIKVDVADTIPALFGSAVHKFLEETNTTKGDEREFKFEFIFNGFVISGIIDVVNKELKCITDYKTCSVSKIQKADFNDWRMQGLIYAYGYYKLTGIKIQKVKFLAMMKDWSKIKAYTSMNYPQSPVYIYEFKVDDSDLLFVENWLKRKLDDIKSDKLCSNEDKWNTGDVYAVYKPNTDKAVKLCGSEEEAKGFIELKLKGTGEIRKRDGDNIKCKYYCPAKEFCEC